MATEQQGPFDRILRNPPSGDAGGPPPPDRAAIYIGGTIVGLALLLLVLVLPPISVLNRGGDGNAFGAGPADADRPTSSVRSGIPRLPAGLVAESNLFDLAAPEDQRGGAGLIVPLKEKQSEARNLSLYTYRDGAWERLADAQLVSGGTAARGDVPGLPGNIVVLRRDRAALQVAGSIPAGTTVQPEAATVLTTLHPIVFIPTDEGGIIGQPPAVPPAGYEVVPGIVAPRAEVVDNILRSADLRAAHVAAIADAVEQGNFAGINVDYRGINATLREQYAEFIEALAAALHDGGRSLTLTVPMPATTAGETDPGAFDWERLGAAADTIEMTGELDQELYFQNTEAALDYVTQRVEPAKLLLTISSLSVERGGDGLRPMRLDDALGIAGVVAIKREEAIVPGAAVPLVAQNLSPAEGASGMAWDDAARAVTFSYPGRGGKRTVWLANRFSAAFRLELARRYGLGGIAITDVSVEGGGGDVWVPAAALADSGQLTLSKPNGDLFAPVWSAPEGAVDPTSGDSITWTAPEAPGTYVITIVISDGIDRVAQRLSLDVVEPPTQAAE